MAEDSPQKETTTRVLRQLVWPGVAFVALLLVVGTWLFGSDIDLSGTVRSGMLALSLGVIAVGAIAFAAFRLLATRKPAASARDIATLDRHLFLHVPTPVVLSDCHDVVTDVNAAYERLTGYARTELVGMPLQFIHSGQMDDNAYESMRTTLANVGRWQGEFWLRNKEGEAFSDKVTRVAFSDGSGRQVGFATISKDTVGDEDEKRMMLWQAHHDTLTKLPNRNLFLERFSRALSLLKGEQVGALLSVDLDNFKVANDSVGAAMGDQLLTQAAFRLALCLEEGDTIARLGGDHFMILIDVLDDVHAVERLGRRLLDQVCQPFQLGERELFLTASVGICLFSGESNDSGELLRRADAARLQVKRDGGNNLAFFDAEMTQRAERRLEIESELRLAIREDQLQLHLQPLVDLASGEIVSAEALVRWQHPEKGLISPGEFIPVAEETGLIADVGHWVIDRLRRHVAEDEDGLLSGLRIAVNVSALQVKDDVAVRDLLAVLSQERCDNLTIELTESALIADRDGVQGFLTEAKSLGCRIALDDFGTGFSSLSYLRDFDFDVLKVDKSFIDKLQFERDSGLVASIISMGQVLGMRIVAEGVEEAGQVERLRRMGCDYVQGFYFSRPLPIDAFLQLLRDGLDLQQAS